MPVSPLDIASIEFYPNFNAVRMTLRGHPIKLNDLMREVNKRRSVRGDEQILYNPCWEVRI